MSEDVECERVGAGCMSTAWDPRLRVRAGPGRRRPEAESTAQIDPDVEVPAAAWRPFVARGRPARPRRGAARRRGAPHRRPSGGEEGDDAAVHPGLAASYAAGVVRCDLRRGVAEVATARIARGAVHPERTRAGHWPPPGGVRGQAGRERASPSHAPGGLQPHLHALEARGARQALAETTSTATTCSWWTGRCAVGRHLPRLPRLHQDDTGVRTCRRRCPPWSRSCGPGSARPVFRLGTPWRQLHLVPAPARAGRRAVVRAGAGRVLGRPARGGGHRAGRPVGDHPAAVRLHPVQGPAGPAEPRPRSPGLERKLRGMLGDPRLLHRALTTAAARTAHAAA